jgi:hypothetical protein
MQCRSASVDIIFSFQFSIFQNLSSYKGGHHMVQLHENLHMHRKTGKTIVRIRIDGQPRQRVMSFQNVPERRKKI